MSVLMAAALIPFKYGLIVVAVMIVVFESGRWVRRRLQRNRKDGANDRAHRN
ncbi:MAG: hypothetical protein Q8O75_02055 [bacterium]|nr:hypothetical protein [bacterium]